MPFNGLAVYSTGFLNNIAEDVSDMIGMISPFETPLLDVLTPPDQPAGHVLHEWLEESLAPNTVVSSTNIDTAGTALSVHVSGTAAAGWLDVGAVVKNTRSGEWMQVTAISGNTITVTRGFGSTTVTSALAGDTYFVVAPAALEGSDVTANTSRPRVRKSNYLQIIKKDIIVSGTMQSTTKLGSVADEYEKQKNNRLKEALRDLEKAVIQGKSSGNTIGSGSNYRTMKGIWDSITTNVTSTGTLTPAILDSVIQGAWAAGGGDLDYVLLDANWKALTDTWQDSRVHVFNQDMGLYKRRVTEYESSFGRVRLMLNRWMPTNSLAVVSSQRIKVLPLAGRSFAHIPVAPTGDAMKGMILGEYTVELMNEDGMAKAYG